MHHLLSCPPDIRDLVVTEYEHQHRRKLSGFFVGILTIELVSSLEASAIIDLVGDALETLGKRTW